MREEFHLENSPEDKGVHRKASESASKRQGHKKPKPKMDEGPSLLDIPEAKATTQPEPVRPLWLQNRERSIRDGTYDHDGQKRDDNYDYNS